MAKYDEFGRPIYETAEEYNRAHKKSNNSRTYNSPEGDAYKHKPIKNIYRNQRNAAGTAVKKTNSVILKLTIILIFFVAGSLIGFNTVRSSYGETVI